MPTSYATLGFPNGLGIKFRLDPNAIEWNFSINASVIPTVGGRVVQVTGATLSDMTVSGDFGEDRSQADGSEEYPGRSWRLAVSFANRIRQMMLHQSSDATQQDKMHPTAVFSYPPQDWRFNVYIKDFADPDGGAISVRPEKFSHSYVLTLFIVQDGSDQLLKAGASANGVLSKAKAAAINSYIARISDGIGWVPSAYNGNWGDYYKGQFDTTVNKGGGRTRHGGSTPPTTSTPHHPGTQVGP